FRNRKNSRQTVERAKRDWLTRRVSRDEVGHRVVVGQRGHWRAGYEESSANDRPRSDRAARTAQRAHAVQSNLSTGRREGRVRNRAADACGIAAGKFAVDEVRLCGREVGVNVRERQKRRADCDATGQTSADIAGKEP